MNLPRSQSGQPAAVAATFALSPGRQFRQLARSSRRRRRAASSTTIALAVALVAAAAWTETETETETGPPSERQAQQNGSAESIAPMLRSTAIGLEWSWPRQRFSSSSRLALSRRARLSSSVGRQQTSPAAAAAATAAVQQQITCRRGVYTRPAVSRRSPGESGALELASRPRDLSHNSALALRVRAPVAVAVAVARRRPRPRLGGGARRTAQMSVARAPPPLLLIIIISSSIVVVVVASTGKSRERNKRQEGRKETLIDSQDRNSLALAPATLRLAPLTGNTDR